jgi:hypothetical protein
MGLFSDIISSIGNGVSDIFGGGNNDDQKKKQQQQQQQAPQVSAPSINPGRVQLPAVFQAAQQQQQNNPLHIANFGPAPGSNPLQPQQPQNNAPQLQTSNYQVAPEHQSLFGQLVHGAGSLIKGVAQPFVNTGEDVSNAIGNGEVGLAHSLGIHAGQTESNQQQFGDINNAVGLKTEANTPKNFLLNTAQVAGTVLAPGADAAAEAGAQAALNPEATNTALQLARMGLHQASDDVLNTGVKSAVINTGGKVAANSLIGGGFNAASGVENGENPAQIAKDFGVGALVGGGLSGASGVVPIIRGARAADDETAGVTGEKAPAESGTKSPAEATNAPAGEKNAPPEKAPNAVETGVKPPAAPPEEVGVPPEKAPVEPVAGNPGLEKTGDTGQDLQNATGLVRNVLENGRDYSGEGGNKNPLQRVLDLANSHLHSNDIISKALNSRLAAHLSSDEVSNVRNAIEAGSNKGLSDKEAAVFKALKQNVEAPSNTTRTNLSKDYQTAKNHFPQVRQTSVKDAAQGASKVKGVSGKLNTFSDLLNRNSRFSEGSSMGKFTSGGKTVVGDANDLGLVAKKNGTFVDKAGKVYNYARATSQELENAGTKLQAPKDALSTYTRDTLNLKTRADASDYLIKNADNLGLHEVETPSAKQTVTIKGSDGTDHNFFTDSNTAKAIKDSGLVGNFSKDAKLPLKAWNALSSGIAQLTVVNPFAHGLNLATNAAVGAGERANGIAGASTLLRSLKPIDEARELRMSDAGVHFPTYGKNTATLVSKATGGLSKLNEASVAAIDKHVRAGMFDNLTKGGMSDKEAAATVNKWMGGRSTYSGDQANLGIFWNYFGRQVKNAGQLFTQAAKGHGGPLINAAIASGATYAADQGLKNVTGNQGAYIHAPGVVGILNDAANTAKDVATGQYRNAVNPVVNHINPLVSQAAEQVLGVNNYGDKFTSGQQRVQNLEGMTPESNAIANNGHSLPEKALNTFGIYTPHIKGDAATNNPTLAPVLNVKGAQNGSTVAFPKDFTGEQNSKAVNDYLGSTGTTYSSKTAATIASQTKAQQQAYTVATKALKSVGITSASDINAYTKLAPADQKDYLTATQQVIKSGTTASNATIRAQLVKNGNVNAAANIDTAIPKSIPQESKNALETYSTLGSDGQKNVWLQNNDNADNYYKAVIDQKQANGALTTDDTDTGATYSGSGGSLYVKALVAETNKQNNVPQSLVELYKNTTKTEYNDMSGTQKAELTSYAQQLNNNGVVDKFGLSTGTSGSSSGSSSSSAYTLDRNAGIPYGTISESFVKPTSDPGVKSVSARAFTEPKLAKYAPDTKPNPFVRSISVKAGVK